MTPPDPATPSPFNYEKFKASEDRRRSEADALAKELYPSPLEALLVQVDAQIRSGTDDDAGVILHFAAPRLAAIVRVLRDAVVVLPTTNAAWKVASAALRRAAEIAEGGA